MADEARLHELLDLVEQARREGDTATEAKATAAYRRESSPAAPAAPAIAEQPNTWGQAIKNVAGSAAHLGSGMIGSVAGNAAGLAALVAPPAMIARSMGYDVDPAAIREKVSSALTYTPDNQDSLSMKVADFPAKALGWAGKQIAKPVQGIPYVETFAENLPEVAVNAIGLKAAGVAGRAPVKALPEVPTTAGLSAARQALYKASEDAGVVIKPESTRRVVAMMQEVAKNENLGKLTPKLKEAHDVLSERIANNEPLTLRDADKARQLINDAKQSTDAGDRRLAKVIQTKYDSYLDNLKPEDTLAGNTEQGVAMLKQARDMYRRESNSKMLDSMGSKAEDAGQTNYTQAGLEHALRREFAKLARNDKRMRLLTPEEQAAIKKVVAPGKAANTLRNLGKVDPTRGGMGAAINTVVGGGAGAVLGGLVGGPGGAGAGAIAGQAALGTAANLANRLALRGTQGRVASARETLVGRGLPTAGGVFGKAQTTSGVFGAGAPKALGSLRAQIQSLDAEVKRLGSMGPVAQTVRVSVEAELARLRRELATAEAQGASP